MAATANPAMTGHILWPVIRPGTLQMLAVQEIDYRTAGQDHTCIKASVAKKDLTRQIKCAKNTFAAVSLFPGSQKMPDITTTTTHEVASNSACQDAALAKMMSRLLLPLVRLCLANGVTFARVEELLKHAFVEEADALQPGAPTHGAVSRISTATGLTRREVTRLIKSETPVRSTKPPIGTEVFARWTTDTEYQDDDGAPCVLKRQGPAPSFEALARSITRDVHPRSMLDELVRLGLAHYDEDLDSVSLTRSEFVPSGDSQQMLDLLGDNVGDHLNAAVANVLHNGGRHLEQAVFADELSTESIKALRPLVSNQWKALRDAMVPAIMALIESDRLAGRIQNQRMRIGLYTFDEGTPGVGAPTQKPAKPPKRKLSSKESQK